MTWHSSPPNFANPDALETEPSVERDRPQVVDKRVDHHHVGAMVVREEADAVPRASPRYRVRVPGRPATQSRCRAPTSLVLRHPE